MILITGFTGNTGKYVIEALKEKYPNQKLVGITRNKKLYDGVITVHADLNDDAAIENIFGRYSFDLVIHIARILYSPLMVKMVIKYNIPQIILVHTTGIYSKYRELGESYRNIESDITNLDFKNSTYTIIRPTMIYGDTDKNVNKLIKIVKKYPIIPIIGEGKSKVQPVHSQDLAIGIVDCIGNPLVKNKGYTLSGGSVMEYKEMINIIAKTMNKRIYVFHIPIKLSVFLVKILIKLRIKLVTVEQVERMQEDRNYPHDEAYNDIKFRPSKFEDRIKKEVNRHL